MSKPHIQEGKDTPFGKSCGAISPNDKRLPHPKFEYPDEMQQLLNHVETRELLDEFITQQMFKTLAEVLNRILSDIIESENPKRKAIVIAWSIGLRLPKLSTEEEVLTAIGNRTRVWLYHQKNGIRKMLEL